MDKKYLYAKSVIILHLYRPFYLILIWVLFFSIQNTIIFSLISGCRWSNFDSRRPLTNFDIEQPYDTQQRSLMSCAFDTIAGLEFKQSLLRILSCGFPLAALIHLHRNTVGPNLLLKLRCERNYIF
jgi:hypothetical protein